MTPVPEEDATEQLAARLGLEVMAFVDVFGAEWRLEQAEPWHDYDADPSGGLGFPATPWHVAGTPPQVMARVFDHGVFVARPHGVWEGGAHTLVYRPDRQGYAAVHDLDAARDLVRAAVTSRRRSFTYCRYCRVSTPPELRLGPDTCMGCASRWEGVVY
jgi:hypothetical protein